MDLDGALMKYATLVAMEVSFSQVGQNCVFQERNMGLIIECGVSIGNQAAGY
jgi:hypothetical protein